MYLSIIYLYIYQLVGSYTYFLGVQLLSLKKDAPYSMAGIVLSILQILTHFIFIRVTRVPHDVGTVINTTSDGKTEVQRC